MGDLRIRGLGKAYKRYPRKWDRLAEWLGAGCRHSERWVLRDIGFDVRAGEAVGIIGVNGAGKSTLLKLITGTAHPTAGTIERHGRIAALLELGIGFHGEFTGRENVWTAAALAGLDRATIAAVLPAIEAFADIGDYIDQPVRTYSSGMQVRLAFAVATAVRPDILIVDEALAVGDIFFQQKCFARIRAFREQGTTLLFVSHAMGSVYALCDRAILLEDGRIRRDGPPREVIDLYNASIANRLGPGDLDISHGDASPACEAAAPPVAGSYSRGDAEIRAVDVLQADRPVSTVVGDSLVEVRIQVRFRRAVADPHVGFQVRNARGEAVYMTHTHAQGLRIGAVSPGEDVIVSYRWQARLIPGDYTITCGVAEGALPDGEVRSSLERCQDATRFSIARNLHGPRWDGLCNLEPECHIERETGA